MKTLLEKRNNEKDYKGQYSGARITDVEVLKKLKCMIKIQG